MKKTILFKSNIDGTNQEAREEENELFELMLEKLDKR